MQPLGIIVNELLTNVMKHAFSIRSGGTISIAAMEDGGHARLTCSGVREVEPRPSLSKAGCPAL
jgi:two-component sensor histidine kinase